jgi:hypothetical protein
MLYVTLTLYTWTSPAGASCELTPGARRLAARLPRDTEPPRVWVYGAGQTLRPSPLAELMAFDLPARALDIKHGPPMPWEIPPLPMFDFSRLFEILEQRLQEVWGRGVDWQQWRSDRLVKTMLERVDLGDRPLGGFGDEKIASPGRDGQGGCV